jgi:uncharacterized membrane protein
MRHDPRSMRRPQPSRAPSGYSTGVPRPTRQRAPDPPAADRAWEVVALAIAGAAVAGYLTVTKLSGAAPLLCTAGSPCEIVQDSRYATFLGVPTALWGAVLFAAIGVLAAWPYTAGRWLWSFVLAAAGVAFSAYLTVISFTVLRAACGWCLTSGALMVALLGALLWRRPPPGRRHAWLRPARLAVLGSLVAAATVVGAIGVFLDPAASATEYQRALARHLAQTGSKFYGAYWCPACRRQKEMFGGAEALLPYVECDSRGARARPEECAGAGVRSFPTWSIQGQRREGVLSLDELANASGYTPAPTTSR